MQICTSPQTRRHPTTQFFTGRMPFLLRNQQRQSTEGKTGTSISIKQKGKLGKTCPDITCDQLVISSDSHLLTAGVGDF